MTDAPGRPINILHTIRSLRIDGVVNVVLRNVRHLDGENFRHYVCSMRPDEGRADEFREFGIEPLFVGHRSAAHIPRSILRLMHLIRRLEIDVVHSNRTLDLVLAGTAARLCGVPVVNTLHWLGRPQDHPEVDWPGWWHWSEKLTTVAINRALAHRIVAVSEAVRDTFAQLPGFPLSRVEVVYPGLDMKTSPAEPGANDRLRRELGLDGAGPILLNVGRLHPVKGQQHLVPMMLRVRQRLPRATLLIAGDGELRASLERLIDDQGLGDAVRLLGARSDVDGLLAISDVLILASESEAAPLPLFEAMRAGKPVVATAVGGVPEIVEPGVTGYVVARGDPEALADGVFRVFEAPGTAAKLGAAGRRRGTEHFEIAASARALELIYQSLARH